MLTELSALSEISLLWQTEDETRQFAARLAASMLSLPASNSTFITLEGDLGAGKTTFVRHLLQAMGVTGRIKSPTYTVVESYAIVRPAQPHVPQNLWHFDFYRFNDPHEWEEAGFRDIFANPGYKLAEWPEKVAAEIPMADIAILIVANLDESRRVTVRAQTPLGQQLVRDLTLSN
ncbi:MAG: tRNA (adenosine(37)-N6)-threonylcarbamoyltransferase complex ATPase subunit type 1 TsaE [Burkholderiaceae bacterium]|nr:tRNA (adenosine(37)-N6)-threonylcarbamoyltransferase complex ATPase subunit type 1 TsaE [Burkholderiaceae bacterium]